MIDRKTALASVTLIALMLAVAAWRIITLDNWTTLTIQNEAPLPSLLLFVFPACSALVVGALYLDGRRARAHEAKLQPWRRWGKSLSVTYCGGLLLVQGVVIVRSLDLDIPLDLSAMGRALGLVLAIMCLLAINQMPKLPWFERSFAPGGELGPIYGPRYMRTQARLVVVLMIAAIASSFSVGPSMGWHFASYILLASGILVVWSIAWRIHLGRKWKVEHRAARG